MIIANIAEYAKLIMKGYFVRMYLQVKIIARRKDVMKKAPKCARGPDNGIDRGIRDWIFDTFFIAKYYRIMSCDVINSMITKTNFFILNC